MKPNKVNKLSKPNIKIFPRFQHFQASYPSALLLEVASSDVSQVGVGCLKFIKLY